MPQQLILNVTDEMLALIERIRQDAKLIDDMAVLNNAVSCYAFIVDEYSKGSSFFLRDMTEEEIEVDFRENPPDDQDRMDGEECEPDPFP